MKMVFEIHAIAVPTVAAHGGSVNQPSHSGSLATTEGDACGGVASPSSAMSVTLA